MMRRGAVLGLALLLLSSAACATKRDVDGLRGELALVQSRQDSVSAEVAELRRSLTEELEESRALLVTTRGDLRRQLDDMERQLVTIQELLGQSQAMLHSLRSRIESREWAEAPPGSALEPREDTVRTVPGQPAARASSDARALYTAAIEQFRRGAYETARTGFQEFLVAYPADELAPDAQYYLAETFREEGDAARAVREYNRVVELYPNSRTAPTALYKAGLLQVEQGNKDSACQYFQRVTAGYPRSDESRLARDQAQRLNCR